MAEEMIPMEDAAEPWILTDETGKEIAFEPICQVEYNGELYYALSPMEEVDDVAIDEYIVLKLVTGEDGEESLETIDNEAEWEAVADQIDALLAEVEDHDA